MKGIVKWFNEEKGFGFIKNEEGKDIFCHYSEIQQDGFKTLNENDEVEFEEVKEERGVQAKKVVVTKKAKVEEKK